MNNWYEIFWFLTIADEVKTALHTIAVAAFVFLIASLVFYFISVYWKSAEIENNGNDTDSEVKKWAVWVKAFKTVFIASLIICFVSECFNIFIPSKRDALIIIAGGAVGNFITKDSTSKQIPHEVMELLSTKIKAEIKNTDMKTLISGEKDTLQNMTKEELIKKIKEGK